MDISEFTSRLYSALLDRGVEPDRAEAYLNNLKKYLTPEDVADVTDVEIRQSADVCANQILKRAPKTEAESQPDSPSENEVSAEANGSDTEVLPASEDPSPESSEEQDNSNICVGDDDSSDTKLFEIKAHDGNGTAVPEEPEPSIPDTDTKQIPRMHMDMPEEVPPPQANEAEEVPGYNPIPDPGMYGEDHKTTPRGRFMLVLITAISSPLWLIAAVLFFLPFLLMFLLEFALTAALVCLLAGGSAAGAAASLTGIVYGIIMMFSTPAVGLYEIGFGIIIGGVTMICGILIYNAAVRFMPWLIRKSGGLFKKALNKVKPLIREYRRRCEKL